MLTIVATCPPTLTLAPVNPVPTTVILSPALYVVLAGTVTVLTAVSVYVNEHVP